jgi:ABC-type branched-subunit amino acid transport system ATPase component
LNLTAYTDHLTRPSINGRSLAHLPPPARARAGLGRTFQQTELFDSLTVAQNVALGAEAGYAGWNPIDHMVTTPSQRTRTRTATQAAIALCGLGDLADASVSTLTTGQRRVVELARCLAGDYEVILLDEPSSGLDQVETQRFGAILTEVAGHGTTILLVEHDMALVNRICDHVFVIDFGKPIFDGTVAQVAASPIVRHAYLGDEELIVDIGMSEEELS